MRTAPILVVIAAVAFIGFYFVMQGVGFNRATKKQGAETKTEPRKKEEDNSPQSVFPEELSPVVFGKPATKAAKWDRSKSDPACAVLAKWNGKLHRWQDYLDENWRGYSVEETELVLVVSRQRRKLIQTVHFTTPANAPPVKRFRHDVDVWLVEAKTGKTLAAKTLIRIARPVNGTEPWALTELGKPVGWKSVENWMQFEVANLRRTSVAAAGKQ